MATEQLRGVADVPRVGMIGLGVMGYPMLTHLISSGFQVTAYARDREVLDAVAALGGDVAQSAADLGARVDTVVLVLPDAPDVEQVLFNGGLAEALREGSLVIDCTTQAPEAARSFEARLGEKSIGYVDAPVSGGQVGATEGTLSVMVGGNESAVQRARPILQSFGSAIVHMGGVGAGQITKACNQLVVAGTIELVAEALGLAARSGVSPSAVREALLGGFAGSRVLERHGARMIARDFEPGFRMSMQLKDVRIVSDTARLAGAPTPAFDVVVSQVVKAAGSPDSRDLDHSSLILTLMDDVDRDVDLETMASRSGSRP